MVEKLTKWQPIETAPEKHLARFLLYVTPRSDTEQTIYEAKRYNDQWANHIRLNDGYGSHNEHSILARATHWQPLPAPPGTTRAPADLRSALEAETACERLQKAWDSQDDLPPIIFTDEEAAALYAALAPTKEPAA